jgi:DNA-binding IscR family transcriptional regulator
MMQIGTKFSIALHILLTVEYFKNEQKVTGQFISSSAGTNLTIIRNIMGMLRNAGIIEISAGTGGTALTRPADKITLYDVYAAVDTVKTRKLFKIHKNSVPQCLVGGNILNLLEPFFLSAQSAMENDLNKYTLQDLLNALNKKINT